MQPTAYFFLGANSMNGFHSLYNEFCHPITDTLHIIKSGPGTGKSTFMRRIGAAAELRGYEVEYILCSGDPHSLDGVYIPDLHTAWVDGTAPHIIEPQSFGVSGDYVNLGQFCRTERLRSVQEEIQHLTAAYRQCYQVAYPYLRAAGILLENGDRSLSEHSVHRLRKRAQSKIHRELTGCKCHGPQRKRFLRGISAEGVTVLTDTLETLCTRLCVLESHCGIEQLFFEEIIAELQALGADAILCPHPLCPHRMEAVLLPSQQLGFVTADLAVGFSQKIRTIHLDAYADGISKSDYKGRERQVHQLLGLGCVHLAQAKALHDDLEQLYRPALDVDGLNAYTDEVIADLFGQ